ncbi:MAG TPA: WGxxGxxG family protein [Gemmatimonadaceae bacterium]|jgi:hypothetical protein|nr:WGxxGxxG family protein [Gemmatimonadaceae bacterium]
MRESEFRRTFQSAALVATIAIAGLTAPGVAAAQGAGDAGTAQTTTTRDDGDQDWGWIGLLGLAGLLGLRRRDDHVHTSDTTTRRP